ncbi:MAG: hypothetical protein ACYS8I_01110 [Planctomycetota bacterium]|jgi:hypothetical protein
MDRFADHSPPVRSRSEFQVGKGLLFNIDSIEWLDKRTVEAEGGYYGGPLTGAGHTYRLRRHGGKWKVISDIRGVVW